MASKNVSPFQSFVAGANLSATDYRFVKSHTTQNQVVASTADTDKILGIRQNSPASGEECRVQIMGKAKITLGGTVTIGAWLTPSTAGSAIATTTDKKSVGAIALQAGDSGEVIECLITHFTLSV